ncbi:MAG TPA: Rrf2 family transcriptional regulator [Thermoguttaceae bacterium]|nr:Rrf2 family transcriptional regulator [Thermoguttaceae bacterium]HPP52676.1 Rrf2 family transcriptional regulator [Thermoguttaceae bacterium]
MSMKVSAKTEYACIAVLELASRYGTRSPMRVRQIADRHRVPARFLVQILLQLKGAGFVMSTRGASGGYQLVRPPEQISLGEVVELMEGGPVEQDSSTAASPDSPAVKALQDVWNEAAQVQRRLLQQITFAQLLEKAKSYDHQMYYI